MQMYYDENSGTDRLYDVDYQSYLEDHGFNFLTGEACNYSMRILVDMDQQAVDIMADYLCVKPSAFYDKYNSSHNDSTGKRREHIASMKFDRIYVESVVIFCAIADGYNVAIARAKNTEYMRGDGHFLILFKQDRLPEGAYNPELTKVNRVVVPYRDHPHVGSNNVHAFTGRAY